MKSLALLLQEARTGLSGMDCAIGVDSVRKVYGDPESGFVALESISLDIRDNEFFTLLGPSGCGKTTLLRVIAGFEDATAGGIRLFDEALGDLPPNKRPINTVFQHYALFPHMTVADNVAFGLRRLGKARAEIDARVAEMLDLVQLSQFSQRRPSELSGGQQQRVAVARSLAPHPKVLLLDEPLSALDLKLRQAMRVELKRIQRDAGITFIFVTHDQEEALAMSDRIAVLAEGKLQQVGTPTDIYESPRNRFVAQFIGDANLIEVNIDGIGEDGTVSCRTKGGAEFLCRGYEGAPTSGSAQISVRPERLSIQRGLHNGLLHGAVRELIYLGTDTHVILDNDDCGELLVRVQNAHTSQLDVAQGDAVSLKPDPREAQLLSS